MNFINGLSKRNSSAGFFVGGKDLGQVVRCNWRVMDI